MARATATATIAAMAAYGAIILQQILYARALGVSADTDALAAALAWAVATSGLVGTTLQSTALPRYAQHLVRDPTQGRLILGTASAIGLGIGVTLMVLTLVASGPLANLLLPGSSPQTSRHLETLLRLTAPLHVTWVAVWLAITVANARERFVLAALAPISAAVPVIALLLLVATPAVDAVAVAYVAGTLLQVALVAALLRGGALDAVPRLSIQAFRTLRTPLLGLGASFLLFNFATLLLRALGSTQEAGDVAAVDYAARIALATEQVLVTGLLAVALTRWSKVAADGDIGHSVARTLPVVVDVALLLGAALIALGTPAVSVVFGARAFDQHAIDTVGGLLAWMAPGIAGHLVLLLLVRALLAKLQVVAMVVIGVVTVLTLALVGVTLLPAGLPGIGIAYSVSWLAAAFAALLALRGSLDLRALTGAAGRGFIVAAGAGVAAVAVQVVFPLGDLGQAIVGGAVLAAVAIAGGWVLQISAVKAVASWAPWRHTPA